MVVAVDRRELAPDFDECRQQGVFVVAPPNHEQFDRGLGAKLQRPQPDIRDPEACGCSRHDGNAETGAHHREDGVDLPDMCT